MRVVRLKCAGRPRRRIFDEARETREGGGERRAVADGAHDKVLEQALLERIRDASRRQSVRRKLLRQLRPQVPRLKRQRLVSLTSFDERLLGARRRRQSFGERGRRGLNVGQRVDHGVGAGGQRRNRRRRDRERPAQLLEKRQHRAVRLEGSANGRGASARNETTRCNVSADALTARPSGEGSESHPALLEEEAGHDFAGGDELVQLLGNLQPRVRPAGVQIVIPALSNAGR